MDVSALARSLLSQRLATKSRARIRLTPSKFHRDKRFVLFPPATGELRRVVRRFAGRVRFLHQRESVHYPPQKTERCGNASSQFLRLGRAPTRGKTRPVSVA